MTTYNYKQSNGYILSFFLSIFLLTGNISYSQTIDFDQTLEYLNGKFDGKCLFKDKKKYVLVSFFKNGEVYREDKVYLKDLEPDSVSYSPSEKAVNVRCRNGAPECIERKIIHLKKIDHYYRLSIPVENIDDKSIKGITEAFTHLIKLVVYSDHERTTPFE